jgi:flagellin-like hook-associated protein FlgL
MSLLSVSRRRRLSRVALVAMAASLVSFNLTVMAQSQPVGPAAAAAVPAKEAEVKVTRVALFSSGVGYFEHFGSVAGDGTTSIRFKADQINDVLKSLVLQDLDGGSVSVVRYPSQDPLGRSLKGFAVDLTGDTSMPALLMQLRGAEVEVSAQGEKFKGTILSVESRTKAVGQTSIAVPVLNVVTDAGVRSIEVETAQNIRLLDADLQQELNKALAALAGARDKDKKLVNVDFRGQGDRRVRMGYVVETPVWKTSYRLLITEKEAKLQGWAIVENQTDNDWSDIQLSLVSGRPLSFTMDLYEPLYLARPEAKLELFEGLKPQSYAEAREEVAMDRAGVAFGAGGGGGERARRLAKAMPAAPAATAAPMEAGAAGNFSLDASSSVAAQASSGQIGELFEYVVNNVNLPRQSSAMIPIVTDPIDVEKISIYNRGVLARYPLNGARLNNTTGKNLLQGPITVFEQGGYAGDAQINNVGPGQKRLISYGIDLQTLIDSDKTEQTSRIITAKLIKGALEIQTSVVTSQTYKMENKADKAKTVVIEHPKAGGKEWKLVESPKPVEETDAIYRFEQKLEPKQAAELVVKQQTVQLSRTVLANFNDETLLYYTREGAVPEKVREALRKAIELRQAVGATERSINESTAQVKEITDEQSRIRENMKSVDRTSQYYTRLMAKLDQQESQIEKLQTNLGTLRETLDGQRKTLEDYLKNLTVE